MSRVLARAEQKITSPYGLRSGGFHNGIDLGWSTPESENNVYSNCKGKVVTVVTGQGNCYPNGPRTWGNYVKIQHDNGYSSLYAHLDKIYVKNGQEVDENTIIATMGNTGYSNGRHLHFEVKNASGYYIDPTPYLSKSILDNSTPSSNGNATIKAIQSTLNSRYNTGLAVDGVFGPNTKKALVKGLQTELNSQLGANLVVDGIFGANTKKACPNLSSGMSGNITYLVQAMLNIKGYNTNGVDGIFGKQTNNAVKEFQSKNGLSIDSICGKNTFEKLFT